MTKKKRDLRLILMPTEACNFRCTYCYEDFSIGKMSSDVENGVAALVERQAPELSSLQVDWFGGEPLAASALVARLQRRILEACKSHNVPLRSTMTTNGYTLDLNTARGFVDLGIQHYQISIDGSREIHDRQRPTAGGKPTFDRIFSNILEILDSELSILLQLRVHYSAPNIKELFDFLDEQVREICSDPRVNILLKPIKNLSTDESKHVPQLTRADKQAVLQEATELLPSATFVENAKYACYACSPNSFVVRADGRIGKCTVALSDPINTVGKINSDGSLEIEGAKALDWLTANFSQDEQDKKCPYRFLIRSRASEVTTAA